jgi:hypothetical protein
MPYDAGTDRSRPLILGLYGNSVVQSFRGKKEQANVCIVCLSVRKSMTTEEATCRIVGWKVTNSKMCLAPSVVQACMQASKQAIWFPEVLIIILLQ